MFALLSTNLVRGVVQISLIVVVSALVGALSALAMMHRGSPAALPASHQIVPIDPTCTSSSPCIEYDNTSTGTGMRGVSFLGNGVNGQTKFNSTSSSNGKTGVFGNDLSTSGTFDSGIKGSSVRGMGVYGVGSSGVVGESTLNTGAGADFLAQGKAGANLFQGNDVGGNPTFFVSSGGDVFTRDIEGRQIEGLANLNGGSGIGLFGDGSFAGVYALNSYNAPNSAAFYASGSGGKLFVGRGSAGGPVFEVDDAGNVVAHSFIASFASAAGQKLVTYSPQASEPTMEDFGEAQLTNGSAYVRLEPRFASTIARGPNYLVFITPEGDNRGLYVTQKTLSGFAVHESQGGHSTLVFSYRIVARPYGNHAARLPIDVERLPSEPRGLTRNSLRPPQPPLPRQP
jgi:hypothetical protein